MSDEAARIASAWQMAYVKVNRKPAPCVEHRNGWYKIEGSWHCQSEIEQRTERLRQMAEDKT